LTVENATSVIIENATIQPAGPDWSAIAVAVATILLACITGLYMYETRKMRKATENILKNSQQPNFAIEPVLFNEAGDEFNAINLVNNGQTATNITARCMYLDGEQGSGSGTDPFYIISLSKDGRAYLKLPIADIVKARKYFKLEIECKDINDNDYKKTLVYDFDKIKQSGAKIAYQYTFEGSTNKVLKQIRLAIKELKFYPAKVDLDEPADSTASM
jgi:hypothetical protein